MCGECPFFDQHPHPALPWQTDQQPHHHPAHGRLIPTTLARRPDGSSPTPPTHVSGGASKFPSTEEETDHHHGGSTHRQLKLTNKDVLRRTARIHSDDGKSAPDPRLAWRSYVVLAVFIRRPVRDGAAVEIDG